MSLSICFISPGLTGPPHFRTLPSCPILNLLRTPQVLLQALASPLPYPPPCHRYSQSHRIGLHHQQIHEPPKTVSSLFPLPTSPSLLHSFLDCPGQDLAVQPRLANLPPSCLNLPTYWLGLQAGAPTPGLGYTFLRCEGMRK